MCAVLWDLQTICRQPLQLEPPCPGTSYVTPFAVGVCDALIQRAPSQSFTLLRAGFLLELQRVIIKGARLAPPTGHGGVPVLLPPGLFSTAPAQFSMVDTRVLVTEQDFQTYLAFFAKQLDAEKLTAEGGSITMYTVSAVARGPGPAVALQWQLLILPSAIQLHHFRCSK